MLATDLLHGFIAIHFRHHNVHQYHIYAGIAAQLGNSVFTAFRGDYVDIIPLKDGGQREKVANIVIHDEYTFSIQDIPLVPNSFNDPSLIVRKTLVADVEVRDRSFQEPLDGINVFLNYAIHVYGESR